MYATFRKHQKALLAIASGAVIVSFVIYFNPAQSGLSGLTSANFGRLYGRPLRREEVVAFDRMAALGARLRFGESPDGAEARQAGYEHGRDMYQRLFFNEKFHQLGITVGSDEVGAWVRQNLSDPKTGKLDYEAFLDRSVKRFGFTEQQFVDFVRYEIALGHLMDVVGVAGELVTPGEAEAEFRRRNEQALASAVFFSSSNYVSQVAVDPGAVAQFFTNRLAAYRIPVRWVVSYVRWDATNHFAEAEASMTRQPGFSNSLAKFYADRGPEAFHDTNGNVMTHDAAIAAIRKQAIGAASLEIAAADARKFANELYAIEPSKASNLAELAAKKGMVAHQSAPFGEFGRPAEFEDAPVVKQAVKLSPEQPFSRPIAGTRGVYLIALVGRLPSETPAFDTVRARVAEDFRRARSQDLARAAGEAFAAAAKAVGPQRTFEAIAAEQRVTVTKFQPFSLVSESLPEAGGRASVSLIKDTVFELKPGAASSFVSSSDGGFVAYLDRFQPVSDGIVKAALNGFLEEERRERRNTVFNAWFTAEFQKSGLTELLRPASGSARSM